MRNFLMVLIASAGLLLGPLGIATAFHEGAPYNGEDDPGSDHPTDCASGLAVAEEHGADIPGAVECP